MVRQRRWEWGLQPRRGDRPLPAWALWFHGVKFANFGLSWMMNWSRCYEGRVLLMGRMRSEHLGNIPASSFAGSQRVCLILPSLVPNPTPLLCFYHFLPRWFWRSVHHVCPVQIHMSSAAPDISFIAHLFRSHRASLHWGIFYGFLEGIWKASELGGCLDPQLERDSEREWLCFPRATALPDRGPGTQHSCLMTKTRNWNRLLITCWHEFRPVN